MFRRIGLVLLLAVFLLAARGSSPAFAISYAAGWNLVSGPTGSTLVGASGSIYTVQPGDADYESFPANSQLKGGWGYWAFFPSGGSLQAAPGSSSYSVTLVPGQPTMIGNPSAVAAADVAGADSALTYTPGGDYQSVSSIPAGQGAWVTAQGNISLTISAAPVATAPSAAPPSQSPRTAADLKAAALGPTDVPGYQVFGEESNTLPGALASYLASWRPSDRNDPTLLVFNALGIAPSVSFASGLVTGTEAATRRDRTASNVVLLPPFAVGDEEQAVSYTYTASSGNRYDDLVLAFRRGAIEVHLDLVSALGTGNVSRITRYAQAIDARLGGGSGSAPAATVAAPAPQPAHALQYSGTGGDNTPTFTLSAASARVCVTVSGTSPSGTLGPSFSVVFYRADGTINSFPTDFNTSGCKNLRPDGGAGRYYLEIIATSWTNWSITVDAQ